MEDFPTTFHSGFVIYSVHSSVLSSVIEGGFIFFSQNNFYLFLRYYLEILSLENSITGHYIKDKIFFNRFGGVDYLFNNEIGQAMIMTMFKFWNLY